MLPKLKSCNVNDVGCLLPLVMFASSVRIYRTLTVIAILEYFGCFYYLLELLQVAKYFHESSTTTSILQCISIYNYPK